MRCVFFVPCKLDVNCVVCIRWPISVHPRVAVKSKAKLEVWGTQRCFPLRSMLTLLLWSSMQKQSTELELSEPCDPLTLFESVRHSECLVSLGTVRSDRLDPKAIRVRYDAGIEALCIVVYRWLHILRGSSLYRKYSLYSIYRTESRVRRQRGDCLSKNIEQMYSLRPYTKI